MYFKRLTVLGTACLLAASPAAAQMPASGMFELGLFGQYTDYGRNAGCLCQWPEDGIGFGGRAAVFYDPTFSFELDAGRTVTDRILASGSMSYATVAARAMANYFVDDLVGPSFFVGAGPMLGKFEGISTRYGASGVAGLRFGIVEQLALRIDGVADYMPSEENLNLAMRAGGSFMVGYSTAVMVPLPPPPPPPPPAAMLAPAPAPSDPAMTSAVSVITAPAYFDFDRSELRPDGLSALEIKLPWLDANPEIRLRLEGNADDRGSTAYNLGLGMQRAAAVRDYLIAQGIRPERLEIVSYGDTRLRCTTQPTSETCHQVNRRVDFEIIGGMEDRLVRVPE